ncbi:MAG: electron transfer flavoprotein subunit alpha [Bacteroidetes bacterium 4572_77]|nr:MAG: electron transfer flavoprotein subunit alpha [Bacteroidetes bacterium 4572_77]
MSVLVYTENWDGKFKKSSFELVSYAHAITEKNGGSAIAISIGQVAPEELEKLAQYGASKVLSLGSDSFKNLDSAAYAKAIATVAQANDCNMVVFGNNNSGKGIAPRVAVKLKAALVSGASALPESYEPLRIKKNVFNGKAIGYQQINSDKAVITLAQNSYEIKEAPQAFLSEDFDASGIEIATSVQSSDKVTDKLLLTDAEVVVSGGRGMKSAENWAPLEELASVLGAATACSRPVSDEGWRKHEEHVGQTGKIIAPDLYFALGISGAIQHIAGVSSSKVMVAVNTDVEAPVFESADYGIVGDLKNILPKMVEEAKKFKEGN